MFTLLALVLVSRGYLVYLPWYFQRSFHKILKHLMVTYLYILKLATVILTLVLLGQLLEARAHSQTSGAIKELLKLVPSTATLVARWRR